MKTPSRRMKSRLPLSSGSTSAGTGYVPYAIFIAVSVGLLAFVLFVFGKPTERLSQCICVCLVAAWFTILGVRGYWAVRRLQKERKDDSICTFARQLPAKSHDTWIVRAVYEVLTYYTCAPVRASDRLDFDGDDLDDIIEMIAEQAERSLEYTGCNPSWGKVETVKDVILFLEHQPRLEPKIS